MSDAKSPVTDDEAVEDARTRKPAARKPEVKEKPDTQAQPQRGSVTPAQYEGDGWGDTPVQMRG